MRDVNAFGKLKRLRYHSRIKKLKEEFVEKGLNGVIIVPGPNMRYYTGGNSLLLERPFFMAIPLDGDPHLVTPNFEAGPYLNCPFNISIHKWSDAEGPAKAISETVADINWTGRWGVEGRMPFAYLNALLKSVQPHLENADPILQGIRSIKDPHETSLLSRSAAILSKAFTGIPRMLSPGMTELELSQAISRQILSKGAESATDVLVQSGPMAADGHHLPSGRKLRRRESIVIDATCTYGGYFADITRTFILGKDSKFEKLYESLKDAQAAALKSARTGVSGGSVDNAARAFLRGRRLDNYFVHRTGHGLGLEVHEEPYIAPNGTELLRPSMAFTIEPGIYMSGKTGLRIEDDVLTTKSISVVLTKSVPKDYGWWN